MKKRKFTDEQFIEAVKNNFSKAGVMQELDSDEIHTTSYRLFNKLEKLLNVDTSHFTGQAHLKGKTHDWGKTIPFEEVFCEHSTHYGSSIRRRLIREGILQHQCSVCDVTDWQSKELYLELDHIDGINDNNQINNLRIICPNCHSQTPTFCGRNKGNQHQALTIILDQDIISCATQSISMTDLLKKLGMLGHEYAKLKSNIIRLNIDTSHFKIKEWKNLSNFLVDNIDCSTNTLKQKLVESNMLIYECAECNISHWQDKPLVLQMDHIDGNDLNNQLSNLRLLCPNCHSQTSTYCIKNKGNKKPRPEKLLKTKSNGEIIPSKQRVKRTAKFCTCGTEIHWNSQTCKECRPNPTKIVWPCADELIELVNSSSMVQAGKQLGVSDSAIKKHLKNLNLFHLIKDGRK